MYVSLNENLYKGDGMEKREVITTTFYPKAIIEYVEKKGFITTRDLEKDFGYNNHFTQMEILSYLKQLSILTIEDDDWEAIEEENKIIRKYKLTEKGKKAKQYDGPVVFRVGTFPVFSKLTTELFNELTEVSQVIGMGLEDIAEMAESNPTKLKEMIDKIRIAILSEYNPEELRELGRELKDFFPRSPKAIMEQ